MARKKIQTSMKSRAYAFLVTSRNYCGSQVNKSLNAIWTWRDFRLLYVDVEM